MLPPFSLGKQPVINNLSCEFYLCGLNLIIPAAGWPGFGNSARAKRGFIPELPFTLFHLLGEAAGMMELLPALHRAVLKFPSSLRVHSSGLVCAGASGSNSWACAPPWEFRGQGGLWAAAGLASRGASAHRSLPAAITQPAGIYRGLQAAWGHGSGKWHT